MKRAALAAAIFLAANGAVAQTPDPAWSPNPDLLSELDGEAVQLRLTGLSAPLQTYQRYYRGTMRDGRLFVEGYFGAFRTEGSTRPDSDDLPPEVHLVTSATPSLTDAGCRVVFLLYDVSAGNFTSIQCQGPGGH